MEIECDFYYLVPRLSYSLTAVMDHEKTIWIKEETSEISGSPGSIVQVYPCSVKIKEEPQETGNQELLQDPLKIEAPFYNTKEDPGLKLNVSLSEHSYLEDPFIASGSTDHIKEDSVLNLGAEEIETFVKLKWIDIGGNSVTEGEWMM
ncbi:uncharacterized protein LOC124553935 [Schistocerca americana]|uniref:uncharacterized protein LOC124553935 n=1 Tax=Schistocerca americana TaxID=7009 RepID=UPI001F4F4911|nr:uncharacterized protein LOC124553935 [Schistocerca americana]